MPVVRSHKDVETLTVTFVAEFAASVERVWQLWQDPRKLERWWGPPGWPATFERHEFAVGGRCLYHMTGPDGEKSHGWWRITAIEAPHRLELDDGFADERGRPLSTMESTHSVVTIEAAGADTRMTIVTRFASAEQLERVLEMGLEEGTRLALGQIDGVLAEEAAR